MRSEANKFSRWEILVSLAVLSAICLAAVSVCYLEKGWGDLTVNAASDILAALCAVLFVDRILTKHNADLQRGRRAIVANYLHKYFQQLHAFIRHSTRDGMINCGLLNVPGRTEINARMDEMGAPITGRRSGVPDVGELISFYLSYYTGALPTDVVVENGNYVICCTYLNYIIRTMDEKEQKLMMYGDGILSDAVYKGINDINNSVMINIMRLRPNSPTPMVHWHQSDVENMLLAGDVMRRHFQDELGFTFPGTYSMDLETELMSMQASLPLSGRE